MPEGTARATPWLVTIVIGSAPGKEPMFPVWLLIVAAAAVKDTELKFVKTPLDGPSMTHSTEVRRARLPACVVLKVSPVVLSVSLRTKLLEVFNLTTPVNESLGLTPCGRFTTTRFFGYISYQA